MKKTFIAALVVSAALASCASYRSYMVPEPAKEAYGAQLEGKTLAIKPFAVEFYNSRGLTVTFDYVKVGKSYTKRYAVEENSLAFNATVGVMQRNILEKSKTGVDALSRIATAAIKAGALGQADYAVPFMKGLGSGNMGQLSNRPIEYDYATTPATLRFLPADGPVSYFSDVMIAGEPGASSADYYLEGEIQLDNEIQHILTYPNPAYGSFERFPKQGDYYLYVRCSVNFKLYDARTGAVVATEKTKLAFPVTPGSQDYYYIPIGDPKDYYELDSFLPLDYSEFAAKAVEKVVTGIYPFISPYTANVQYIETVEE